MGRSVPEKAGTSRKQFMLLDGSPILLHTIRKFASSPAVREIVVALRAEDMEWVGDLLGKENFGKPVRLVEGGDSRQDSVEHALATLGEQTDLVAVHDAVRPFIELSTLANVFAEAAECGGAIVGIVPVDTVKQVHKQQNKADHTARAAGAGADSAGFPIRFTQAGISQKRARTGLRAPMNPAWWSGSIRWKSAWFRAAIVISRSPSPPTWISPSYFWPRRWPSGNRLERSASRSGLGRSSHRGRPAFDSRRRNYSFGIRLGRTLRCRRTFSRHHRRIVGRGRAWEISGCTFPTPTRAGRAPIASSFSGTPETLPLEQGYSIVNVDSTVIIERPKLKDYRTAIREKLAQTLELGAGFGFGEIQNGRESRAGGRRPLRRGASYSYAMPTALITGASGGIGLELARIFASKVTRWY